MADRVPGTPDYIWEGVYPTWQAASAAAEARGVEGLGGERWFRRITQQISDYRDELQRYGVAMPPRPSSLPLVCGMTNASAVIDFGGSSGWCWDYLQNTFPGNTVSSYVVVESEAVVNYMTGAAIHGPAVSYQTLDDRLDPCDLLYCNSVLQYFESNVPLCSLAERTRPQFILLEDLVAKGDEDFFSVQSYGDAVIPYRFLGLRKLLRDLFRAGYTEMVAYPYASPVQGVIKPLEMGNMPLARQHRYSLSVLLKQLEGS